MLKNLTLTALLLFIGVTGFGQTDVAATPDKITHYTGLQVNQLLKQIVNFGNSPSVNNPYLLKYSLRFNQTQTQINVGFGYNYSQQKEKNGLKSDLSNLDFRLGYGKAYSIGKKFEFGIGIDGVLKAQNIQTVNVQSFNFGSGLDSTITTSKSVAMGYGLGPQVTLTYAITDRILIGTEASYYFIRSKQTLEVQEKNYSSSFGGPEILTVTTQKDETKGMDLNLQLPVALFLIITF